MTRLVTGRPATRVLVVEDDRTIARGLAQHLAHSGYVVALAGTGREALDVVRRVPPALVILDLMLPDVDGLEVLRVLRAAGDCTPVLVLTARDAESYTLEGFRLGADDYVVKPFRVREVLARVGALLRRAAAARPDQAVMVLAPPPLGAAAAAGLPASFRFGAVAVDPRACRVQCAGRLVALRPKEYDLLLALLTRRGAVVRRATLLREVWGYDPLVVSRTVETHILELRRKLEPDPSRPVHILTVRTRGYRLSDT